MCPCCHHSTRTSHQPRREPSVFTYRTSTSEHNHFHAKTLRNISCDFLRTTDSWNVPSHFKHIRTCTVSSDVMPKWGRSVLAYILNCMVFFDSFYFRKWISEGPFIHGDIDPWKPWLYYYDHYYYYYYLPSMIFCKLKEERFRWGIRCKFFSETAVRHRLPIELGVSHPCRHSNPGRLGPWADSSGGWQPCSRQGVGTG